MQIDFPFEIEYDTPNTVPIDDLIQSLVSVKLLIEEGAFNLPHFVAGLQIEKVEVRVRRIAQESPLRELLLVGIILAVQRDLEREVPAMFESLTGTHVPEDFKTIFTLSVLVALFYGAAYVKDLISHLSRDSRIKKQMDALVSDLAERTGKSKDEIQKFLDEHYKPKGRIKALASAAIQFFRPSKSQSNAPIRVNDQEILRDVIAEIPAEYAYEEALEAEKSRDFPSIELELHAQDKDRESTGWAAVPKGISEKRLRMKLVDGVSPSDLWGKDKVKGDITVKYKRVGTDMVPAEIHLTRIKGS